MSKKGSSGNNGGEAYVSRLILPVFQPLKGYSLRELLPSTSSETSFLSAEAPGCTEEQHTPRNPTKPRDAGLKLLNPSM